MPRGDTENDREHYKNSLARAATWNTKAIKLPQANKGMNTMGAYCLRALIPSHAAQMGEILKVLWSDYYGAALFGDREEIACIPHKGCRLEILATAESSHRDVNRLLPGQVIRYKRWFFLDRFELPSKTNVSLWHLVGFKLQLAPSMTRPLPVEGAIIEREAQHRPADQPQEKPSPRRRTSLEQGLTQGSPVRRR